MNTMPSNRIHSSFEQGSFAATEYYLGGATLLDSLAGSRLLDPDVPVETTGKVAGPMWPQGCVRPIRTLSCAFSDWTYLKIHPRWQPAKVKTFDDENLTYGVTIPGLVRICLEIENGPEYEVGCLTSGIEVTTRGEPRLLGTEPASNYPVADCYEPLQYPWSESEYDVLKALESYTGMGHADP